MAKKPTTKEKHAGGRPTKYRKEFARKLIEYMSVEPVVNVEVTHTNRKGETWTETQERPGRLRFISAFAHEIGVDYVTLQRWGKDEMKPEFCWAYTRARQMQTEHLLQCGFLGLSDAQMTKFAAVNLTDLRDKSDVEHTGNINVSMVNYADAESIGYNPDGSRKS